MSFLAPLFLAGLAALAVPVIIHLTNRPEREVVRFPSLMFVRRIPFRSARRQRIRHWLLFLLRSVALALLALAFARPLLQGVLSAGGGRAGGREVVILLDNSYSMGYGDRWTRGVAAARRVIGGLGPDDQATLVLFADRAAVAAPRAADPAVSAAALDRARVSARSTRYAPALELTRELLASSELARREVVLITDFQAVGWDPSERVRLPDGTDLSRVDLSAASAANVAVAGVGVERISRDGPDRVALTARLLNRSPDPVDRLRVTLRVDGSAVETASVSLPPNGAAAVRFAPVSVPERAVRATVEAAHDELPADDRFHAVIAPQPPIGALLLEHPGARPQEGLYLRRALAIGEDPPIAATVKAPGQLTAADLAMHAVVIVNDAPLPDAAMASRVRRFVEMGGGVLVVLGRRGAPATRAGGAGLLPGAPGAPVDRLADQGGTLGTLDYDHPVFEVFRTPRTGDFTAARIFRYRELDAGDATVLARFDDGGAALVEATIGAGRVLVWTAGFDNFWSDLPVQPVFLPFVHQLVRYLAGYEEPQRWFLAGGVLDLATLDGDSRGADGGGRAEWVVESPSGERVLEQVRGGSRFVEFEESGFYEIRPLGSQTDDRRVVAVNLDPRESDLTALDADELAVAIMPQATTAEAAVSLDTRVSPEERERRQGLWWYLLVAVLLILVAETVVANRRPRRGWIRSAA